MTFPLRLAFTLTLLAFPLLEIALLIKVGGLIGFWPLLAIIVGTAFLGASVMRSHGLSALSRIFAHLEAGGSGLEKMADTALAVTGGALLILPGLICDAIGLLLLLPPVRTLLLRAGFAGKVRATFSRTEVYEEQSGGRARRSHDGSASAGSGTIIEGEYERIDDGDDRTGDPASTAQTSLRPRGEAPGGR